MVPWGEKGAETLQLCSSLASALTSFFTSFAFTLALLFLLELRELARLTRTSEGELGMPGGDMEEEEEQHGPSLPFFLC